MASFILKDGKRVYRKFKKLNGKLISRARWVYLKHYGTVPDGMDVHHKNGDPLDDGIENLELVSHSAHTVKHHLGCSKYTPGESVVEAGKIKAAYHRKWYLVNAEKRRSKARENYHRKIRLYG
jgi:hypothetical protein